MDSLAKTIHINALDGLTRQAPQNVLSAIQNASSKTGVDFSYMVQQASVESGFDADAKARTSSAAGLYQFIESTWLSMVKRYGDRHGLGEYAAKINDQGRVSSRQDRREILALRNDPETAAAMAAEFARENESFLQDHWAKGKKEIGSTELYLAHFMGAGQAASFLKARDKNPMQAAAVLFPDAARSNRNVFYDTKTGRARNLDEVYAFFDRKFEIKNKDSSPSLMVAQKQDTGAPIDLTTGMRSRLIDSVFKSAGPSGLSARGAGAGWGLASYQSMVQDPVQLMLLSQLEIPGADKDSKLF